MGCGLKDAATRAELISLGMPSSTVTTKYIGVSEQFLNSTPAQYRLFRAADTAQLLVCGW